MARVVPSKAAVEKVKKAYKKPEVKSVRLARPAKTSGASTAKTNGANTAKTTRMNGVKAAKEDRIALVVHVPKSAKATLVEAARGQDLSLSAFCRGILAGRIDAP